MAKTYNSNSVITSVATGDLLTASAWNNIVTNVNNYRVPPYCYVRRNAVQSIANSTTTCVTFDTKEQDTDATMFTASSTAITIQTAGMFLITGSVVFPSNATGYRLLQVAKNPTVSGSGDAVTIPSIGATAFAASSTAASSAANNYLSVSAVLPLAVNDVIRLAVWQNSGGALNIGDAAVSNVTGMQVTWVGQVS